MVNTLAPAGLVPHGWDLKLKNHNDLSNLNGMRIEAAPIHVSLEQMEFPGTKEVVNVRVNEMYEVKEKAATTNAVKNFFNTTANFVGIPPTVKLAAPQHVGTVGSFELGDKGQYLLHRQLEASTNPQAGQPSGNRRLLIDAHGSEDAGFRVDKGAPTVKVPNAVLLPEKTDITHFGPSGALFSKGHTQIKDIADLKNHWPVYCIHSVSGDTQTTKFFAAEVRHSYPDTNGCFQWGPKPATSADLHKQSTGYDHTDL